MKRTVFWIIILIAVLTSCAQSTPTQVEEKVEEETTASDAVAEAIEEYRSNFDITKTEILSQIDTLGSSSVLGNKMKNFDYEIVSEKKGDANTTVTVKITTYPFGAKLSEAVNDNLLVMATAEEDDVSTIMSLIVSDLTTVPDKTFTQNVEVYASKRGSEWVVTPLKFLPDFEDAISGGIISYIQAVNETLG